MPKPKILQEDRDYTFRSYFELAEDPDEILSAIGIKFLQKWRKPRHI